MSFLDTIKGYFATALHNHTPNTIDVTSAGVGIIAYFKYLPEVSAGLSAVWVALRIVVLIRDEFWNKRKKDADKQLD